VFLGGLAGVSGTSAGDVTAAASSRLAANNNSEFYSGTVGQGGVSGGTKAAGANGGPGYAVFEFDLDGVYVNINEQFRPVQQSYVRLGGLWRAIKRTWIKQNNAWVPTSGSFAPAFLTSATSNFKAQVITCISVIDNCALPVADITRSWNTFIARNKGSTFFLLQPGGPSAGNLPVPVNFYSNFGNGPSEVTRDEGDPVFASDWFDICNLGSLPAGSVVEFSITVSGSMTEDTVQSSIELFLQKCTLV
jgi:hypothetical protein